MKVSLPSSTQISVTWTPLQAKREFDQFNEVMQEYFDLGHAELVPPDNMNACTSEVFYLPMHAVGKQSSTTTRIWAVFDTSMKSGSGVSQNDLLMVSPTVHPLLVDITLRFRTHRIALVTDVTKMYWAIKLIPAVCNLHRFVWRAELRDSLIDYRMTQVTFRVSSSSFIANMCAKRNAADFAHKYPLALKIVNNSFYIDDCLAGSDSVEEGYRSTLTATRIVLWSRVPATWVEFEQCYGPWSHTCRVTWLSDLSNDF